jgi:hypothetical protein
MYKSKRAVGPIIIVVEWINGLGDFSVTSLGETERIKKFAAWVKEWNYMQ